MTAEIIPFRFSRCVGRTRRTAETVQHMSRDAAEKHIMAQLVRLERSLLEKGVEPPLAIAEVRAYEAALRAEIWRRVITGRSA